MRFAATTLVLTITLAAGPPAAQAGKRETDLAKCQDTIVKESEKQIRSEAKSYHKCIQSVQTDRLKKGLAEASSQTIAKCKSELRKIKDSRKIGKSHEEKAKAKMLKACDPSGKEFTDEDVLEEMKDGMPGLGAKNLAKHCAAEGGVLVLDSATKLIDCVVKSSKKSAHNQVKKQHSKAPRHLKEVKEKLDAEPMDPSDPDALSDAADAAQEVNDTIDANGDGEADATTAFNAAARIAFVTSTTTNGNFSGNLGATEECNLLAFDAGLPGDFTAWVSNSITLAADGVSDNTVNGTIPYVTVAGTLVANGAADFVSGSLVGPINVDETGATVDDEPVWTGTDAFGDNVSTDCQDFNFAGDASGTIGRTSLSDAGWTDSDRFFPCGAPAHIYCIEVDRTPNPPLG